VRRRERGVVLLAVVTALAVLSVLAVGTARTTIMSQRLTAHGRDLVQADALLRSATAVAATWLERHAASGLPDGAHLPGMAAPWRRRLGDGWIEIRVEDAARRIDLDTPGLRPALRRLAAGLGLEPRLIDALADWTDADDEPHRLGAEREWYARLREPLLPANAPLTSVSHLRFVRGFDAAAVARLAPFVSVAGQGGVNPNTASPTVLAAWTGSARETRRLLAARADGVVACGARPHCTLRSAYYLVHARAQVGAIERRATVTLLVPDGLPATVRRWEPAAPAADSVQGGGREPLA
jgi:general secretion pathway protein K